MKHIVLMLSPGNTQRICISWPYFLTKDNLMHLCSQFLFCNRNLSNLSTEENKEGVFNGFPTNQRPRITLSEVEFLLQWNARFYCGVFGWSRGSPLSCLEAGVAQKRGRLGGPRENGYQSTMFFAVVLLLVLRLFYLYFFISLSLLSYLYFVP